MHRYIITLLLMLNPVLARPDVLSDADRLIKEKKYKSAYELLDRFDKNNKMPGIVLKKTDLALKFFAKSLMHRSFAFADIENSRDLEYYRNNEWDYKLNKFRIDEELKKLIARHPRDPRLYGALADYYFIVQKRYGNKWFEEKEKLLDMAEENYLKAGSIKPLGCVEMDRLGVIMILKKKYPEAIKYLEGSIGLDQGYGMPYYNLAYLYYKWEQHKKGLPLAEKSYALASNENDKFDSAILIASMHVLLDNNQEAIKYYKLASEIKIDYDTLKSILVLYLKEKDLAKASDCAEKIFMIDEKNLGISQDILFIYGKFGFKDELLEFFQKMEIKYKDDYEVAGNINFNRAFFYSYFFNDEKKKKMELLKAREYYKKVFQENHEVFTTIKKELKE